MLIQRFGSFLERQGLLERDAKNSDLSGDAVEAGRWINSWATPLHTA